MMQLQALSNYPETHYIEVREETRKLYQNSQQWPILSAFAKQIPWPVNGVMTMITADDWKDILTAAFRNDTSMRIAQGFEGGTVILGQRTREFAVKEWPEWMAFLNWAAAEKNVKIPIGKRLADQLGRN